MAPSASAVLYCVEFISASCLLDVTLLLRIFHIITCFVVDRIAYPRPYLSSERSSVGRKGCDTEEMMRKA